MSHDVYECWISDQRDSFAKLKSDDPFGVAVWLMNSLKQLPMHGHIHIVRHSSEEYADGTPVPDEPEGTLPPAVEIQDNGIHHADDGKLWADASSVGLDPGQWPDRIRLNGKSWTLYRRDMARDELLSVVYVRGTQTLILHND